MTPNRVYRNLFEYLNEVIGKTPAGSGGAFCSLPGSHGNRSPLRGSQRPGHVLQPGPEHGEKRNDPVRGGGAGLQQPLDAGSPGEALYPGRTCSASWGAGPLSPVTAQILADVTGRELEVPENPHNARRPGRRLYRGPGDGKNGIGERNSRPDSPQSPFPPGPGEPGRL